MIPAITEVNFPSYATLHQATASFAEMGERVISTQVRIDGDIVPDFSGWELSLNGERFIMPNMVPQAAKDNSTRNAVVDLTFSSWVIEELKRYFFFETTSLTTGTALPDKYKTPVVLSVEDFVVLLNRVLDYYFDGNIVASLYMSGSGIYSTDRSSFEIDYTTIWGVLTKFYEVYGLRWKFSHDENSDIYTIEIGYPADEIDDHDFEYGYQGGLLRFERQVQDVDIKNILLGRGGEKNIPYRYFKREDPQNPGWAADPDAIPELANIYFDRLRDINFRWYVRGWMTNPNRDRSWEIEGYTYPSYNPQDIPSAYLWAYLKGATDDRFNPVEYVRDLQSITEYGERWGALEDNDEIYPTIQGISRSPIGRVDEVVAVSDIITDDIEAMSIAESVETNIEGVKSMTDTVPAYSHIDREIRGGTFTVPTGQTGKVSGTWFAQFYEGGEGLSELVRVDTDNSAIRIYSAEDDTEVVSAAIPAGTYYYVLDMRVLNEGRLAMSGTFGINELLLVTSAVEAEAWKPTFDIWVKDIWGTTREQGESDVEYSQRVWGPILGDRVGNEAKVVFSSGFMSVSEDYEFTIIGYPVPDDSKYIFGVGQSAWKITLRKSDAEYEATGLYIPNATSGGKPVSGDKFFFIGIDQPHMYVVTAEEDLNTNKEHSLDETVSVNPTWIINLDKVRINTLEDGEYENTLASRLSAGAIVNVKDKRFLPGQTLSLYVQSITYTWNEPSDDNPYLYPDVEVVLSDKIVSTESAVSKIQNDIQSIRTQYARLTDVESAVRRVAEPIFLKKTGESDKSASPTQFASKVTSDNFRQGDVGGAGWGTYRDGDGASVFEADKLVVREELRVNSLIANQIAYVGGKQINSAASIECTQVVEDEDGYICYFDQKRGSVKNLFVVGDIAYGQVFNPENVELRYYKRLVTETGEYYIKISKTQADGSGVPEKGDVIVQYGNTTNTDRQFVIVRDVIGGGYERMLSGLDSVDSDGKEYYFAGMSHQATAEFVGLNDSLGAELYDSLGRRLGFKRYTLKHRWFVGDKDSEYAEWVDGALNIKGRITVRKSDGTYVAMSQFIEDNDVAYLKNAMENGATVIGGGLILSSVIALGQEESGTFKIYAGMNGTFDQQLQDPTKSIAAWYGGEPLEKADWDAMSAADKAQHVYAKSLFRMDGSGYLAGGNIYWDANGYGGIPGVTWQQGQGGATQIILDGDVRFGSGAGATVAQMADWFEEVVSGNVYTLKLRQKTISNVQYDRNLFLNGQIESISNSAAMILRRGDAPNTYGFTVSLGGFGNEVSMTGGYGYATFLQVKSFGQTSEEIANLILQPSGKPTHLGGPLYFNGTLNVSYGYTINAGLQYGLVFKSKNANAGKIVFDDDGYLITEKDQVLSSDISLKTNFRNINLTIDQIADAPAVSFDWRDGHGRSFGTIAQYWMDVLPESVHGKEGSFYYAYSQSAMVCVINLAKEVRKLRERIKELGG